MDGNGKLYHFVITLQWAGVNTFPLASTSGTITVRPGQTRHEVFEQVRDFAIAKNADKSPATPPAVTFFSLEPDEL